MSILSIPQKHCTKCGREFPATTKFFRLRNQGKYLRSECRECEHKHKLESQKRNRASANERARRYGLRHPDKRLANVHRRRAHKLNNGGSYTQADIELQLRSQKGRCWYCGKPLGEDQTIDHLIPLSRGGSNAPRNIVIAHLRCNLSKGAKLPHEYNGRLL